MPERVSLEYFYGLVETLEDPKRYPNLIGWEKDRMVLEVAKVERLDRIAKALEAIALLKANGSLPPLEDADA